MEPSPDSPSLQPSLGEQSQPSAAAGHDAPSLLTVMIADMRGYTQLGMTRGIEIAAQLTSQFADIAEDVVTRRGGKIVELRGDEVLAIFSATRSALLASLDLQARLATVEHIKVGIGIDAGDAYPVKGGYRGTALNLAARLCSLAAAGEVLASDAVTHLARKLEGVEYRDRGQLQVKGFAEPVTVLEVIREHVPLVVEAIQTPEPAATVPAQELPISGFLGSLPSGPLAGRDGELARILDAADAVLGGDGRLLLLAGEPGVGKTRLAQEATLQLRNRTFLLGAGRCYEPEQTVPYYPFLDALTMIYAGAPPLIARDAARRWPFLGALLPDQIGLPELSGEQDDQQRVFRAVTGFLEAIAADRPVALLLDDLHWADAGSLKLLLHLARHTRSMPIFLLGTYRDMDVGRRHPLEGALRDLHREGLMDRIDVRRLDQQGTAHLVALTMGQEDISQEFAALLHGRTEGNPYFVQQVLRVLIDRGDIFHRDGVWDRRTIGEIEVPESIRSVIGQRLSRLDEQTQDVLQEASVFGPTFSFDDLLVMTNREERSLEEALDEAARGGLVRETGRDTYGFDHALTQQALYAELPARRKRRLHLAAGAALEGLPEKERTGRVAEIAWHFLEGDAPERALPHAMEAGNQAEAVFAHEEAEAHYQTVVQLARELDDRAMEAQALEKLGLALEMRSLADRSLEALEASARVYQTCGDLEGEARATAGIGSALMHLGDPQKAIERLEMMIDRLERHEPSATLSKLSLQLGAILYGSGEYDASLKSVGRAAEVARSIGDVGLLAGAENYRGDVLMQMGKTDDARQVFEAVMPSAEASGDLGTLAHSVNDLAATYLFGGHFAQSQKYATRAVELQRQKESPAMIAFAQVVLSYAQFYSGAWSQARSTIEQAVRLIQSLPPSWQAPFVLTAIGMIETAEGRWEEATSRLEQAIALGEQNHVLLPWIHQLLAERELLEANPTAARDRLEPFATGQSLYVSLMLPTLAWAQAETGDVAAADATVTPLVRDGVSQLTLVTAEALWVQGIVRCRQDRRSEGERSFDRAVTLARSMSYPYAEGRALYEWGRMHAQRGDREQARGRWEEALVILQRLGARPYVERIGQELAALSE